MWTGDMKIMFFGLGSIGKRHARLIKDNFDYELYAYRSGKRPKKNDLGIKEVYDLKEVAKISPDVAFITNPTDQHVKYAIYCAKQGIHLFIEKPISNNREGVDELLRIVKEKDLSTYIGYDLRFHPAIIWLKDHLQTHRPIHVTVNVSSYLPNWRKNIDHLKHYSAFSSKGGGVILELSHEIDYLFYLFGEFKEIKVNSIKADNVTVDAEDFADILIEFKNHIFANLHMNFFSRLQRREIIVDFPDHTLVADLIENRIAILEDEEASEINFEMVTDDIYLSQLKYFFTHLKDGEMMNNLEEAIKVFDVIMEIKELAR